jgi:hypothetical protein
MTETTPSRQLPEIYLTPRAAETARAAGIIAVRPNLEGIETARDFINARMFKHPEYRFPAVEEVSELTFLMRWAGKGNKLMWQWDTIFDRAKPGDRWLNGWQIDEKPSTDPYEGYRSRVTKGELDPAKTVEMHIEDWSVPELGRKLAAGVMHKWHGRSEKNLFQKLGQDFYEALEPESASRATEVDFAGYALHEARVTQPFDLILARDQRPGA